jgi:hypothetical protein
LFALPYSYPADSILIVLVESRTDLSDASAIYVCCFIVAINKVCDETTAVSDASAIYVCCISMDYFDVRTATVASCLSIGEVCDETSLILSLSA